MFTRLDNLYSGSLDWGGNCREASLLQIKLVIRTLIEKLKKIVSEKHKLRDPEQVLSEEWKQWTKGGELFWQWQVVLRSVTFNKETNL